MQSDLVSALTSTFDATLLTASPTGIPDLPTGTYALPISAPSAIQNSCLSNTGQSSAWSCSIPMVSYTVVITPIPGTSDLANNEISLTLGNNTFGNYYSYGAQPPVLNQDQVLSLVIDSQEPSKGPAWFFEMPYNKVVILPESALTAPVESTNSRRNIRARQDIHSSSGFQQRKSVAQPGDKPWFCYWNGTLLETFIYVGIAFPYSWSDANVFQVNLTSSSGEVFESSSSYTSTVASSTGPPGSTPTTVVTEQILFPPPYPKVLKIEERRVPTPQSIPPYCK